MRPSVSLLSSPREGAAPPPPLQLIPLPRSSSASPSCHSGSDLHHFWPGSPGRPLLHELCRQITPLWAIRDTISQGIFFFLIKCKFHCVTPLFKDSSVDSHSSQDRVRSNPLPWHQMIFAVCISINFHSPLMAWLLRNPSTPNLPPFTWRFPNLSCFLTLPCLNSCWRGPGAACPSLLS